MATVWARSYLKSLGAKDDDIDYNADDKAVTYKGKNLLYGVTPNADGKAMVDSSALDAAFNRTKQNNYMQQYEKAISKPVETFNLTMKDIKKDPNYAAALESFTKDENRNTDTSLVRLGRRGIGNSSSAQAAEFAGANNITNFANTQLPTQIYNQRYQQYLDRQSAQEKQNANLLNLANSYNGFNQQSFENTLASNQDARNAQAQDFNQNVTTSGITGYYQDPRVAEVRRQMDANSAAWNNASASDRYRLHQENFALAESIGATYDPNTGEYVFPQGTRTMAGQAQDQGFAQQQYENEQNEKQLAFENKLKQELQTANLANLSADNARAWASEARQAGMQQLGVLLDTWDRTGVAPAGLEAYGVQAGTQLGGKSAVTATKSTDYKTNPEFAQDVADPETAKLLLSNKQAYIDAYGYDGYQALKKEFGLD